MRQSETSWAQLDASLKKLENAYKNAIIKISNLENENSKLKEVIFEKNEAIKNLETQGKITKIANNLAEDTQRITELKLKINEYIREIDKCIAFLSND